MSKLTKIKLAVWEAIGTERFGPDKMTWRFICPCCKHIQTPEDFRPYATEKGPDPSTAYFSCIGRWSGHKRDAFLPKGKEDTPGPCNYTSGGLFNISPVMVIDDAGKEHPAFDFAEAA